jgi:hypothetical protein
MESNRLTQSTEGSKKFATVFKKDLFQKIDNLKLIIIEIKNLYNLNKEFVCSSLIFYDLIKDFFEVFCNDCLAESCQQLSSWKLFDQKGKFVTEQGCKAEMEERIIENKLILWSKEIYDALEKSMETQNHQKQ